MCSKIEIIIGSIVNIIGRDLYTTLNEHNILLFDIEYDIHTSFGNYEESDHGLHLDWLITFY